MGRGAPVILCHGLGGNPRSFDLPGTLGPWLAARGFEVFIPTLRGGRLADWLIESRNVHARVAGCTGRAPAWVGHSLGGLLPLLSTWRAECSAVVGLGTTAWAAAGSPLARVIGLARALSALGGSGLRLPQKKLGALEAPLMGRVQLPRALRWVSPAGIEGSLLRRLHREGVEDLPIGLVADLHQCHRYLVPASTPTLLLAGAGDGWAPPKSVRRTARLLGSNVTVTTLSRAAGHGDDYGHAALLFGVARVEDVYQPIARFLAVSAPTVHPLNQGMESRGIHDPACHRAELHHVSRPDRVGDLR